MIVCELTHHELNCTAGIDVQRHWLHVLSTMIEQQPPNFLRDNDGVQKLLDALRSFCWFDEEQYSLATQQEIFHPVTGQRLASRPSYVFEC